MVSEKIIIVDKREFDVFTLELRDDGILHLHASGDEPVGILQYNFIIKSIGEITGGKKVPLLATADEFLVPDQEVRKVMARHDSNPYSSASALVTKSLPQKIIANFFTNVLRPARPIQFFNNQEDAINWLRKFM